MSGIEIAGFVLAALTAVIGSFEHSRDVAKGQSLLFAFEANMRKNFNDVKDEQVKFRLHMELLLRPLIDGDVLQEEDLERLLEDPGGSGWKDDDIESALKLRLGQSLERYLEIMQELQAAILRLLASIGLDKPAVQEKMNRSKVSHDMESIVPRCDEACCCLGTDQRTERSHCQQTVIEDWDNRAEIPSASDSVWTR